MSYSYSFLPRLVLRTPRRHLVTHVGVDQLQNLLVDAQFMEALYLASPVLHAEASKWANGQLQDPAAIRKLEFSLLKYFLRMSNRCTPFGLFSGCTMVNWNEGETNVIIDSSQPFRHTRFDMHYPSISPASRPFGSGFAFILILPGTSWVKSCVM